MLQTSWIVLEPYLGQRRYTVQETRQSTVPFPQNQVLIYIAVKTIFFSVSD